jgi:uncharacterized protein
MLPKPIIVLDTNTLLSTVFSSHSISAQAFRKALSEGDIVYSSETLAELTEVFSRQKFDKYVTQKERQLFLKDYKKAAIPVFAPPLDTPTCRDPKDDKYLALALAAKAKVIVSGDIDLLVLNPFHGIIIVKSSDFLNLIL